VSNLSWEKDLTDNESISVKQKQKKGKKLISHGHEVFPAITLVVDTWGGEK
jgi:hypothetical protein